MHNIEVWVGSIGTCVTGFALVFFAYKQNKINKRQSEINQISQKIEIALRYQNHYIRLSEFIEKFNSDSATYMDRLPSVHHVDIALEEELHQKGIVIRQLKDEAELSFGKDVTGIIENKILANVIDCNIKLKEFIKSERDHIDDHGMNTNTRENDVNAIEKIVTKYKIYPDTKQEMLKIYQKYTKILREPAV
jgi:hypothetical protein